MPLRILVLHGPNLSLAREGSRTLATLDAQLVARAAMLDAEVKCFQANGEGALLDELHRHLGWVDAVIINPSSLASIAWGLADALELVKKPTIEVQLGHERDGRGRSALKRVVDKQFHGQGFDGYLKALEALTRQVKAGVAAKSVGRSEARAARDTHQQARAAQKTIGRKQAEAAMAPVPAKSGKSIGRKATAPLAAPPVGSGLTRSQVREQLGARLSGKVSPAEFAAWARTQYLAVQGGAPCEAGQREQLEDVLMMLAASAKASDELLLSTMAKLDS